MELISALIVFLLISSTIANLVTNYSCERRLKKIEILLRSLPKDKKQPSRILTPDQKAAASLKRKEWWAKKKGLTPAPIPQESKED